MSITSGFYDSVGHDRVYNAIQMSQIFDGLICDGVFMSIGSALAVRVGTGLSVIVGLGRSWFNHSWTFNDSDLLLQLTPAEIGLDRIDAVVIEMNSTSSVRANTIKVLNGVPSTTPVSPTLTKANGVYQYPLCYIYVAKGVTSITQANITPKIGTSDCPYVASLMTDITVDDFFASWQGDFETWFAHVKSILDSDQAGHLQNECDTLDSLVEHNFNMVTTGTVHAIPDIGSYKYLRIKADADYLYGDTFSINGTTVAACMQNGQPLPYKYFTAGNYVSCVLNGATLNFKSAGGGGMLDYNLYAQPSEPAKKEGIWIKSDHGYTNANVDNQVFLANSWLTDSFATPPTNLWCKNPLIVGSDVYLLDTNFGQLFYKYSTITNTWTTLANYGNIADGPVSTIVQDNYIYALLYVTTSTYKLCRYSISNNTWTQIAITGTAPSESASICKPIIDNKVYGFTGNICFNWLTFTWESATMVCTIATATGYDYVSIGAKNYVATKPNLSIYDMVTNTYSTVPLPSGYGYCYASAIVVGGDIYFFGVADGTSGGFDNEYGNKAFKFNTDTLTWTALPNVPQYVGFPILFLINFQIHVCGYKTGTSSTVTPWQKVFTITSKQYAEDTFILLRNSDRSGSYCTELVTAQGITGSLYTRFADWFNDAMLFYGGTLHNEFPTYYGDGTKYVKFKN